MCPRNQRYVNVRHSDRPICWSILNFKKRLLSVQIDEDLTARINMADYKFSFHEKGREYSPAWMAPEGTAILAPVLVS